MQSFTVIDSGFIYVYEQGEQKCYDFELFWLYYWFSCFVIIFFSLSFASLEVSVSFPGNIIEFVELFLIDRSSKVHRIGRHWKGDLVKGTVTSLEYKRVHNESNKAHKANIMRPHDGWKHFV